MVRFPFVCRRRRRHRSFLLLLPGDVSTEVKEWVRRERERKRERAEQEMKLKDNFVLNWDISRMLAP